MSSQVVRYSIIPSSPEGHLFTVQLELDAPDSGGQVFSLPAWIPGSYMIRDFARNIISIAAFSASRPVALSKLDKHTWQCDPCDGPLRLEYEIYAWDLSVRSAHLDNSHAYFNGTSVFMQARGFEGCPCEVELQRPEGERYRGWRVATAMPRVDAELHQFGRYRAENYEALIDHPVEMGEFSLATFEVAGVPHDIAITGHHAADMDRLCRDLKIICEHHVDLFGELPEMERYVFQVMAVGEGYGGLEHRASTSLLCKRSDLPLAGDSGVSEGYRTFLGLCSHEYFHTWNVKRIKPAVFTGCDLDKEVHTNQLWAYEGITSYYDDLSLVRSGLIEPESYLELLGQLMTRVVRTVGRFRQSVAASSFDTWTRFYKQDENAVNAIVSYYAKGALLALGLDMTIRQATGDRHSLDDVMQRLWHEHGKTAVGTEEKRIEELASEVAGVDLGTYFENYLYGTEDVPVDALLLHAGVACHTRQASGQSDMGGKPAAQEGPALADMGVRIQTQGNELRLAAVLADGPAMQAGLSAGDELVALDGLKVDKSNFEVLLKNFRAGDIIRIHAFRRDELLTTDLQLREMPEDTVYLTIENPALSKAWLHR